MTKRLIPLFVLLCFLGSCAPAPAVPTSTLTATSFPSRTPSPTQTSNPTLSSSPTQTIANFSVAQIRTPSDTDGREVLTSLWSWDGWIIYYALADDKSDALLWFELKLSNGQVTQDKQLFLPPTIYYPPNLPGGLYDEYQGLISPSKRYSFKIVRTENSLLYLLDSVEHSKVKLLETPDLNFRGAFWSPDENSVVFGVGPEYGTTFYLYDIRNHKLSSFEELLGYTDPNVLEWALSPDGKYIAILDEGLEILSLDGSFSTVINGNFGNVRWAGNSKRIYFYSGDQLYNPTNLGYFDLTSNSTTTLMSLNELEKSGVDIGFFDVSPDGNQLVLWQAGDIWLLSLSK
ncbi:MAG TPA: hypothetical protein PKE62_01785 [Anaerolineales bacterium]|nr:hypothetical protein [Anaerolineales bacterium]